MMNKWLLVLSIIYIYSIKICIPYYTVLNIYIKIINWNFPSLDSHIVWTGKIIVYKYEHQYFSA